MRRLLPFFLLAVLLPVEAAAYTTVTSPASRWPRSRMPVPWYIHQSGSADVGIDASERETQASFDNWQNVTCAYITFSFSGRTSQRAESSSGRNVISWTESGWRYESYAVAVTQNWFGSGTIEESDIECNGVTQTWNTSGGGGVDMQSILTHEIGHFLGLGHTSVGGATMYPSYSGGTAERTPATDDINGVCFLYPDDSGGCTVDGDCPSGYHCDGGSCVPNSTSSGRMCDPCTSNADCVEGYCLAGFPDGGSYCGKNCRSDADCGAGNTCFPVSGGTSQCAPADGDCSGSSSGCTTDRDCPSGQHCDVGSCVPDATPPDCTTDSDCESGYVCRYPEQQCVEAPPSLRPFGASCGADSECQTGRCMEGYCTSTCPPADPLESCPDGYYCDDLGCGDGRCRRGGPGGGVVGVTCTGDTECATAHCELSTCLESCDPTLATNDCHDGNSCQPGANAGCGVCLCGAGSFGDPCNADSDCVLGLCLSPPDGGAPQCTTACAPAPGVAGGRCPAGAQCMTVAGRDGNPTARCFASGLRLGARCASNEECQSGICAANGGARFCSRPCNSRCGCPLTIACSGGFCTPAGFVEESGCGCRAAGASSRPAWIALAALFLVWCRRWTRRVPSPIRNAGPSSTATDPCSSSPAQAAARPGSSPTGSHD